MIDIIYIWYIYIRYIYIYYEYIMNLFPSYWRSNFRLAKTLRGPTVLFVWYQVTKVHDIFQANESLSSGAFELTNPKWKVKALAVWCESFQESGIFCGPFCRMTLMDMDVHDGGMLEKCDQLFLPTLRPSPSRHWAHLGAPHVGSVRA